MRQYRSKSFVLLMLLVGLILLAALTTFIGLTKSDDEARSSNVVSVYGLPVYEVPNIRFADESGLSDTDYMLLKLSMLSDINASYGCDIFIWGDKAYSSSRWDEQFLDWASVMNRDFNKDVKDWEHLIKEIPGFRVSERVGDSSSKFVKENGIGSGNILDFPELRSIVDTCATVYNEYEFTQEAFDSLYAVTLQQLRNENSKDSLIATLKSKSESGAELQGCLEQVDVMEKFQDVGWVKDNRISGRAFEYAAADLADLTGMTIEECYAVGYGAAFSGLFDEVDACGDLTEIQKQLEMGSDARSCFTQLLKFWDSAGPAIYAYEDERRLALQT